MASHLSGPNLTAGFQYDALGRRQSKTVNGTTTAFLSDGHTVVQELTGDAPTATLLTGLGVDEVFTRTDTAGSRIVLSDALGSTLALTDSSGVVQTQYTYAPFGETTVSGAPSTNAFQYTGRENDGTGLYYYRARYYHPTRQRFLSEDPIGFAGGDVNLYGYVFNDPLNFVDPSGHVPVAVALAVVACPQCAAVAISAAVLVKLGLDSYLWSEKADPLGRDPQHRRFQRGQDALDQLESIEKAQQKNPRKIDSTEKSKQRVKNDFKRHRTSKDLEGEYDDGCS